MKTVFKRTRSSVAYCSLSIKSGTRNEGKDHAGLAHLTEHMLFKGTSRHHASYINSRIELLGGDINAYTTKEETVLYSTVLKGDLFRAIDLIFEIVFCSTFPENELEKEKKVILDEINSYKDSPSELIYDNFEEMLFKGSDLSTPVLGNRKSVMKATSQDIRDYVNRYFVSSNMVLSVVADMTETRLNEGIGRLKEKYAEFFTPEPAVPEFPAPASSSQPFRFNTDIHKKGFQAHCIIGGRAYSYKDPRRITLILLTNILGGPASNSVLNTQLREKNGLVYTVEANYNQYCDTGIVCIYFGSDKSNADRCAELIYKELEAFRNGPISETKLKQARKQLIGQLMISADNGETQCLSMGKSVLAFGEVIEMDAVRKMIEEVSAEDIRACANEIFSESNLSRLTYR